MTGGPATYAVELVRALCRCFPDDSFTVLTDKPESFSDFAETVHLPLPSAWHQPLWDHVRVRSALSRGGYDLYHGTKGVVPWFVATPSVVTIHDLANMVMPETFSFAQRLHLGVETPMALRRARRVITVSRSTAKDIAKFFPRSNTPVDMIYEAAPASARTPEEDEVAAWKTAHGLSGPCVGYIGTIQPRKNLDLLTKAFLAAAGDRAWTLLMAGRRRPGYEPDFLTAGDKRVRYLGPLPDADLPVFLGSLTCMVSPSAYEGFGLSFLEAMSCGCPVIGLANSSVPEVVGDAGVLVEHADVESLSEAIEAVVTDVGHASDLARRGLERSALFSWADTARKTRAVYQSVLEAPAQ